MKSIKIEDKTIRQSSDENSPKVEIFWLIPVKIIDEEEVLLYAEGEGLNYFDEDKL